MILGIIIVDSPHSASSVSQRGNPIGYVKDECVACMEIVGSKTNLRAPCGHFYDEKCLVSLIQRASTDESLFPPRCCRLAIPKDSFLPFIARETRETFERSSKEFSTRPRDRVYCSNPVCSDFLGAGNPNAIAQDMHCPRCDRSTCSKCRCSSHPSTTTCKRGDGVAAVESLRSQKEWQSCPECARIIELTYGCFHITCICSTQFCYRCGSTWKTCKCPHWEERLLLAEAERRVDAEVENELAEGLAPAPDLMSTSMQGSGQPQSTKTMDGARSRRVEAMASMLRNHHACNHTWSKRSGQGQCAQCSTCYKRYLLVSGQLLVPGQPYLYKILHSIVETATSPFVDLALGTDYRWQGTAVRRPTNPDQFLRVGSRRCSSISVNFKFPWTDSNGRQL